MKIKKIFRRFVALTCALMLCCVAANAQSSGDKLYNQGLALQKTMTKTAQNQAIAKFQSAKKLYDSAAKKKQCDDAIAVSRNIIAGFGKSGGSSTGGGYTGGGNRNQKPQKETVVTPTVEVSNKVFHLGQEAGQMDISVTTNQNDWSVAAIADKNGASFVHVSKLDNNKFRISVPYNESASPRTQYVQVSAASAKTQVEVSQAGRDIELISNKNSLEFGKKSKTSKIEIQCNSDARYSDNFNVNWEVAECPSWVTVVAELPKEKGGILKIVTDKIDEGKSKLTGEQGRSDMVKSNAKVTCDALPGGVSNRKGEIVLQSGYKQCRIIVIQHQ